MRALRFFCEKVGKEMIILLPVLCYLLIGFGSAIVFRKELDRSIAPTVVVCWPFLLFFFGMLFLYDRVIAMLEERGLGE